MIGKILVAHDGSAPADKAFDVALELGSKLGAQLIVLSVAQPPEPPEAVETEAVIEGAQEYYDKVFDRLRAKSAPLAVEIRCEIRVGHPADQIIHAALDHGAQLIVLGHRGKSLVQRWLMGSISRRVVSYAKCSVLVAR